MISFHLRFSFSSFPPFVFCNSPTPTPKKAVTYPIAPLDRDRDCYNFNYKNRGKAIIFNHQEFHASQRYEDRRGTMKDAKSLEVELKKLDFDVESHLNLKTDDVQLVVDRSEFTIINIFHFKYHFHRQIRRAQIMQIHAIQAACSLKFDFEPLAISILRGSYA